MVKELGFEGRVALITGAGGGLGRAHALALARRGAKVVVNDLGGSFKGGGASTSAADAVVAEIREAGGEAVANYDSVENGDKIVQTAVERFGHVDIVVNNAGILRDVSFHKMTDDDWDLVYRVHVLGAFRVTHAAWPIMRERGFGRVVMTASAAGIYGNFGQANYAMAKLGILGFANTLAIEGRRKNIHVNTIAPIAASRMTETVLPEDLLKHLKPEQVAPLVAWLCHEDCDESGGLFEVGGGFMAKLRWERSAGATVRIGRTITAETVRDRWSEISDFENAEHPAHIAAAMQPVLGNIEAGPSKGGNDIIDVDAALGYEFDPIQSEYTAKDVALYALSVGAAHDPGNTEGLRLVYEMHRDGMVVLPSFAVIPALGAMMEFYKSGKQAPGLSYGFERILHGEQYLELSHPLPTQATLVHRAKIKSIYDKGKHAVVTTEITSNDEHGRTLARNEIVTVVRGAGGWGGDRGPKTEKNDPPDRTPDATAEEAIPSHQALLYRLTGDINPLHADPAFAKAFGFERPILHGLCTFGFAIRHVLSKFAPGGDPRYFKSVHVRFADSVFPGETLVTEMWKESDQRILFQTRVKERDRVVISNATLELFEELPKPLPPPAAKSSAAEDVEQLAVADATEAPEPTSWDVFIAIRDHIERHSELLERVGYIFQFRLTNPESVWTVNLKDAPGGVSEGESKTPDCTLEISDSDFLALTRGDADPMNLFTGGKLKISGNVMASQKLEFLQNIDPQEARQAVAKARAAGEKPGNATTSTSTEASCAPDIFARLEASLEASSAAAASVNAAIQFEIDDPSSSYFVNLKGKSPVVRAGKGEADARIEIKDADLASLASGERSPQDLFQRGLLHVEGDLLLAHKLSFLTLGAPSQK